jgi:hypothetical protein
MRAVSGWVVATFMCGALTGVASAQVGSAAGARSEPRVVAPTPTAPAAQQGSGEEARRLGRPLPAPGPALRGPTRLPPEFHVGVVTPNESRYAKRLRPRTAGTRRAQMRGEEQNLGVEPRESMVTPDE